MQDAQTQPIETEVERNEDPTRELVEANTGTTGANVGPDQGVTCTSDQSNGPYTTARFEFLPTPPESPPSAMFAACFTTYKDAPRRRLADPQPWERKFLAALSAVRVPHANGASSRLVDRYRCMRQSMVSSKRKNEWLTHAEVRERIQKNQSIHESELEPPPRGFHGYDRHTMREEFRDAEMEHLASHTQTHTWDVVKNKDVPQDMQVLDCMWVYVYKFTPDGFWIKCKARLVVRGDQQLKQYTGETYAATLALRSFRMVAAMAAHYDLEMKQYDAVNAFVNAELDEPVYMQMPLGHKRPGHVLLLRKALYGLRKSPKLWQEKFSKELNKRGFEIVPDEPCCMVKEGLAILYYVDDFILVYPKTKEQQATSLATSLNKVFPLTGGDDVAWFLGIEIIRDRQRHLVWLSQAAYAEKIHKLAKSQYSAQTPMGAERLVPCEDLATHQETRRYQEKVGSLMYAAITTRPDIAYATAQLSRFLVNPGPQHHKAADRVLNYVYSTAHYALELGGGHDLEISSDASFADNLPDRKSTQAYTIRLFGGLIAWRSNKQDTVTTSSTEAELLALSQASRESMCVSRIIKGLHIKLKSSRIRIQCDNQQTIRLVTEEYMRLQTKLRHVDIHNHWLRQEVARKTLEVVYTPSNEILADGFTKPLQQQQFLQFRTRLKLVDKTSRET